MSRDAINRQPTPRLTPPTTMAGTEGTSEHSFKVRISLAVLVLAALALPLFAAAPVGAARPQAFCGAPSAGWELIDFDEWWERTVAAGLPLDVFTREDVEAGLEKLDKNDDGLVCWKPLQATAVGAIPAYFFNGKDNTAARN